MILKVKQNENPYDVIGNYIEKHIPVIDDIIAVISIDGKIHNELLLVDGEIGSTNNFVWQIDWWEGEENVELIDFFFVSDACKKNNNNNDLISRKQAMDAISRQDAINVLEQGFKDATNGLDKFSPTCELIKAVTGIYKCYIGKLQPIQFESCWIPITERPPKALTYVLLTAYDGERQGVGYINTSGKWCYVNEGEVTKGYEPLAWMPLPKPYKR